jgi:hypothetical protein
VSLYLHDIRYLEVQIEVQDVVLYAGQDCTGQVRL